MSRLLQSAAQGGQRMIDGLDMADTAQHRSLPQSDGVQIGMLHRCRNLCTRRENSGFRTVIILSLAKELLAE